MAFGKAMKRSASKAGHKKAGGSVAKKCRMLVSTIRHADGVPQQVRSMICDNLLRTFSTYKEQRHPLQNQVSALVGNALVGAQNKLQAALDEAQQKKGALESEAAPALSASAAAVALGEKAAHVSADSKAALAEGKTALKDCKSALQELEAAAKSAEADAASVAAKKAKLESLATDTIAPVKEGKKHGAGAGSHVAKALGSHLEPELLVCVTRTFSKSGSAWGTFDRIIDKKVAETLKNIVAGLEFELANIENAKGTRNANINSASGAIVAAHEKVKALEAASDAAATAAKEADTAAKAATAGVKHQQNAIDKAAHVCTHAEEALNSFRAGPLAAYNEVDAHTAPPPEPEATTVDAAMEPAPAPAARQAPTVLPSPGVLSWVAQASGLSRSPQVLQSPRTA